MQVVYETLPGQYAILDYLVVETLQSEILQGVNNIDRVTDSGQINLLDVATGIVQKVYWGKTEPNEDEISVVIVDTDNITISILQALWLVKVIGGEYPTEVSHETDGGYPI